MRSSVALHSVSFVETLLGRRDGTEAHYTFRRSTKIDRYVCVYIYIYISYSQVQVYLICHNLTYPDLDIVHKPMCQ